MEFRVHATVRSLKDGKVDREEYQSKGFSLVRRNDIDVDALVEEEIRQLEKERERELAKEEGSETEAGLRQQRNETIHFSGLSSSPIPFGEDVLSHPQLAGMQKGLPSASGSRSGQSQLADLQSHTASLNPDAAILGTGPRDKWTGLRSPLFYGRPHWDRVFAEIREEEPNGNVGVMFCGPKPLTQVLSSACRKHSTKEKKFMLHAENF